jgi:hypothetical protein
MTEQFKTAQTSEQAETQSAGAPLSEHELDTVSGGIIIVGGFGASTQTSLNFRSFNTGFLLPAV